MNADRLAEVLQVLEDAKERLSVHALSDVGKYIDWAITMLKEG